MQNVSIQRLRARLNTMMLYSVCDVVWRVVYVCVSGLGTHFDS